MMRIFRRKGWSLDSEGSAWEAQSTDKLPKRKTPTWLSLMLRNFLADSEKKD